MPQSRAIPLHLQVSNLPGRNREMASSPQSYPPEKGEQAKRLTVNLQRVQISQTIRHRPKWLLLGYLLAVGDDYISE
jgi:hypothetical protein